MLIALANLVSRSPLTQLPVYLVTDTPIVVRTNLSP
jgi:hypothetical protein